jgi:hypothetical protein
MELIERLPIDRIKHLNSMKFNDFKSYSKSSSKNDDERQKQFDMMKSFCQTTIKTRGEVKRIYSYTQTTPLEVGGRLYCGNSLQSIPKKIRGFLLKDIATDLDMKNCHPVILRYLCKINKIHCPELEYYINHRDEILDTGDRDKLKVMYLCAVNTEEINKKTKDANFKKFDKECKELQKQLTSLECYKHIVDTVPISRNYNWLGSAINRILCVFENRILQELINFLNRDSIEICALCFDGLLIYGDHYDNIELISEAQIYIESKFVGLNMQFDYKEHTSDIIMETNEVYSKEWVEIAEDRSYEDVKDKFEDEHCFIVNKNFYLRKFENRCVVMKREHLKTAYERLKYDEIVDKKGEICIETLPFLKRYFEDEDMEVKDETGIYPPGLKCPDNYYNMWRPFDMELVEDYTEDITAIPFIKNHIKILCGNDEGVTDYFINWIAQMIQYPAIKSVCPIFISKEGAGKGTLLQLITKMIGDSKFFQTTQPSRDVWGEFNGLMADAFLVNLDELSKKETLESEGRIKGLITEPTIKINIKGVTQFPVQSFHRFIITTNNEEPISTSKDDRRKFIVRCSDELIGDKVYFNKFYEKLSDINFLKTCYEYFKSIPKMNRFDSIPIPVTEYHSELKEMSENIIERWVKNFTQENYNRIDVELQFKSVYEKFTDWISSNGITYSCNAIQFSVRLQRLKIKGIETKHTKIGNKTIFNIKELQDNFKLGCLLLP